MRYHVVLRGPSSDESGATQTLAAAIAARYGVPVEAISERLAVGGFRVKSDVDLDTAMAYAVDLTRLGGLCLVVDASTGKPVENGEGEEEPVGLAAASGDTPIGLGALEGGHFVVSTLDGEVDEPPVAARTASAFAGPGQRADLEFLDGGGGDGALALDDAPYDPGLAAPTPPPSSADDFAPPATDAGDDELLLAEDRWASGAEVATARAPIVLPEPEAQRQLRSGRPKGPPIGEQISAAMANARLSLARRGRLNFFAGVMLAVLVGFIPAHVIASLQETSAFPPLDKELSESYANAVDPNTYAGLPEVRAGLQEIVGGREKRIAITGALVWLAAAAAFGFVWFRKIRWEALEPAAAPQPPPSPSS